MLRIAIVLIAAAFAAATPLSADTLQANTTSNNGGSPGWGMFFDLTANSGPLTITGMTTASSAAAGATFSIEVYTRVGSGLGGPVNMGPGSSPAGWTDLGSATATQGATAGGISMEINLPNFNISTGQTMGVAIVFSDAGPNYFGTGTPPIQQFSDGMLTLDTGDARTVPFTTGGSFFSSRGLTGSITYQAVPEPSTFALFGLAGLGLAVFARRRRGAARA